MIVLDSSLESLVNSTQKSQRNRIEHCISYIAYFLIGSFCSDGDIHVARMAPCSLPSTAIDASASDSLSTLLDDEWIADNSEKVTRILPGGVNVVGLAFFSEQRVYNKEKSMLKRALVRIQQIASFLTTLGISSLSDYMALVFIECPIGKPMGFIIDVVNRGPDSPTKVSFSALEWVSVVSSASARISLNVSTREKQSHFFTEFVEAIRPFTENLFNCPMALINGEIRNVSEQLFKEVKKKKVDTVEVEVFIDACENIENSCDLQSATNLHEVSFDIEIRAAVPLRSKVGFAVAAVKQHLIRNLTARAELQYESMDIVEEAAAAPRSVHQMPRPATTVLNTHPAILFSDYLFEADTVEDAQNNFDELLGLEVNKERIDEGWERCLEIDEMEVVRTPLDGTSIVNLKQNDSGIGSTCSLLIALSVIVAVVSIIMYLVMGK